MQKLWPLLLTATLSLLLPLHAHAAMITARDTIAGLSTNVLLRGFLPEEHLSLLLRGEWGTKMLSTTTDDRGSATLRLSGTDLERAGLYEISAQSTDGTDPAPFEVLPDTLDPSASSLRTTEPAIAANGKDELHVRVHLTDRYGNPLPGRPVALVASRSTDRVTAEERETDDAGTQTFTVKTLELGTILLRAMDLLSGTTIEETASATAVTSESAWANHPLQRRSRTFIAQASEDFERVAVGFDVRIDPPILQVGKEAQRVTMRAIDRMGRTVKSYIGTVILTTTDPDADVPFKKRQNEGEYTFEERDQGERSFSLSLRFFTAGKQKFIVEELGNSSVHGEQEIDVSSTGQRPEKREITITSHRDGQAINTQTVTLKGEGPPLINIRAMGGIEDIDGETEQDGTFSLVLRLNPLHREFTIRVQQKPEEGSADSGPLHLILDTEPPELQSITFSPEKPITGTSVLAVALSEPDLQSMTMSLTDPQSRQVQEFPLEETSTPGTYQALFTSPMIGNYQPLFTAKDDAGNTTEVRSMLIVIPKPLSTVQNVRGEAKGNAALLEWDPVPEDIDGYRIYVGEDPSNALYTLDTGRPTLRATVSGLLPGKTYYFALTALKNESESGEKSAPAKVSIVGLKLEVTAGDSSLTLEWPGLPDDLPLSALLLEYGTKPSAFPERRTLNGALRSFTLRDLLNGVTYYLRLTPVNLTGEILTELAAIGEGTPQGKGVFQAAPAEPIPTDFTEEQPVLLGPDVSPPPKTSDVGFPPIIRWLAGIGTLAAITFYGMHRHTVRKTTAFLHAVQAQYRMV